MAGTGEIYRRLPGRRRGVVLSASMWMGSDHLLLVKSAWFREEYKRFYLRDIQAIVVAPCARFHVSTPVLVCAFLWLLAGLGIAFGPAGFGLVWGIGALALVATWLAISAAASCRCRLYTAVSRDELPSLYRTWTARRFLGRVKPWIDQAQGVVDPGWIEVERSHVGPAPALPVPVAPQPRAGARSHTPAADLFVLSLFVGALVDFSVSHSHQTATWFWATTCLSLAQLVGAIAVMVQHYRGTLRSAIQKVAIAALVVMGVMLYLQSVASVSVAYVEKTYRAIPAGTAPAAIVVHHASAGLALLLGFIGVVILVRERERGRTDIIKS